MSSLTRKCLQFLHDERGTACLEYALVTSLAWGTSFICRCAITQAEVSAEEQLCLAFNEITLDNESK